MSEVKKTFNDLRLIDVSKHVEKKAGLSYLSWANAVDYLLQQDPSATWDFKEPKMFGTTMMVFCEVTALGKTMKMHLPVMDNYNKSVVNPDARKISDAMMRCLVKCIACFGVALYLYSGEDLPDTEDSASIAKIDTKTITIKSLPVKPIAAKPVASAPKSNFNAKPQAKIVPIKPEQKTESNGYPPEWDQTNFEQGE